MTATTPDRRLRARFRRLTSAAATVALAAGLCAVSSPALAADGDPTDAGDIELSVGMGVHGRITPGAGTTATLAVQNDTDTQLSPGTVTVEINRTPLGDGTAVSTWLDDTEAPGEFVALGTKSTDAVDSGASDRVTIDVAPETLADLGPGVYPIRANLSAVSTENGRPSLDIEADSVLVVTGETPAVGVLVPLTATPDDGVLLTPDELTELTAADGSLTAVLDGVTGTAAVLAIDPAIVASIRVLGTSAPATATEWLTRLDELPNERFALQFGDADATVQSQAGLSELLQPTTLRPFISPLGFPEAPATPTPGSAAVTPSPAPTDAPAPPPDDATLSSIDGAVDGILWPRTNVRAEDLDAFATYLDGDATTILSSAQTEGSDAAHAQAAAHDLLVVDQAVSAAVSSAAGESDADVRQRWLASASAQLYFSAQAAPQSPLLVGLSRDETRGASSLREAIAAVDSPGFDLSSVRSAAPTPVSLVVTEVDETRVSALESLLVDEGTLGTFATVLEDPQVLLGRERIRVLREIGVGVAASKFEANVSDHRAATYDTLHAVSIPPSSTIQLLSANADLPFSVRNDLPWPVTLRMTVAPTDPRLEVQGSIDVVVQANSSARVKVPVSARVGSGELDLSLNLYSPTGVLIDGPQTVRVAVRAEWETIGLVIFGGLAVLLIAGGVIRTVVRRRREDASETDAATDAEAEVAQRDVERQEST